MTAPPKDSMAWHTAGILLIGSLGTNLSENLIEILTFSFTKMRLKVSSAKRRPFCLGLNVLITHSRTHSRTLPLTHSHSPSHCFEYGRSMLRFNGESYLSHWMLVLFCEGQWSNIRGYLNNRPQQTTNHKQCTRLHCFYIIAWMFRTITLIDTRAMTKKAIDKRIHSKCPVKQWLERYVYVFDMCIVLALHL